MDLKAITKSKIRCGAAATAFQALQTANESVAFEEAWFQFLTAWKAVYTVLEQGAKSNANSKQWFERKRTERTADPLFQYLYAARNDEEHGLEPTIHEISGSAIFEIPDVGVEGRQISFEFDPATGRTSVERSDGGPMTMLHSRGPGMALKPVTTGKGIVIGPPLFIAGEVGELTPVAAAKAGLQHIVHLTKEAESLLGQGGL